MSPLRVVRLLIAVLVISLPASFFVKKGPSAGSAGPGTTDAVADEQFLRGVQAMGEEKYARAIAAFTRAIERDPKFVDAYLARGDAYRVSGDLDRAQLDFDHAVRLDPSDEIARERATELRKERAGVGD